MTYPAGTIKSSFMKENGVINADKELGECICLRFWVLSAIFCLPDSHVHSGQ